ncbi:MAG: hypothetical protein WKG52_12395 [Variovorax sp.]
MCSNAGGWGGAGRRILAINHAITLPMTGSHSSISSVPMSCRVEAGCVSARSTAPATAVQSRATTMCLRADGVLAI